MLFWSILFSAPFQEYAFSSLTGRLKLSIFVCISRCISYALKSLQYQNISLYNQIDSRILLHQIASLCPEFLHVSKDQRFFCFVY